jgi:hypothetical protein
MNNNEFNKIDWINIVMFKAFQDYFSLKELQDLSMLSKITRSKLSPVLFKSIRLLYLTDQDTNMPSETCNVKSFQELNSIAVRDDDEIKNNLYIQNSLSNINSELQDIKNYINIASIFDLERSGRYLYSIITNFANLTVLEIHCSTIQYSIFQKLGEYFPMLKTFELCKVVLSKYSKTSNNSDEIIFPINLNRLTIWCVEETHISISDEPYSLVINDLYFDGRSEYAIPNICIPSLKNLQFLRCAAENNGLEDFLKTNHNMEQLHTDTFSYNVSKHLNSVKCLELAQVEMLDNLQNLAIHQNIKTLSISFEDYDDYKNLEKLCLMCPAIEILILYNRNTDTHQEDYDIYLVPILKKLCNLKTLELLIKLLDNEFELIDINHFPHIEKVIISADNFSYLKINFEVNSNLKEIEFMPLYCEIDEVEFLNDYGSYTEWEFGLSRRGISGYKIQ